jgi:tetratricopeptide (TPR) repeat protein
MDRLGKLVSALLRKEDDETETEAVKLLTAAVEQTGQYRYKMRIGDIRMRQINRRLRALQNQVKANADDKALRNKYQDLVAKKLKFELEEYSQRIKNYPTDLSLRYELGKRLYAFKKYDEAIGAFQQAKVDPKHRVVSLEFLGRCYIARGWLEEAIDTLQQGIEAYPSSDDRLAMDLRYQLMLALKQLAIKSKSVEHGRDSQKIASQVLQTDINYRDIRQQMEGIRKLVDELSKSQ